MEGARALTNANLSDFDTTLRIFFMRFQHINSPNDQDLISLKKPMWYDLFLTSKIISFFLKWTKYYLLNFVTKFVILHVGNINY